MRGRCQTGLGVLALGALVISTSGCRFYKNTDKALKKSEVREVFEGFREARVTDSGEVALLVQGKYGAAFNVNLVDALPDKDVTRRTRWLIGSRKGVEDLVYKYHSNEAQDFFEGKPVVRVERLPDWNGGGGAWSVSPGGFGAPDATEADLPAAFASATVYDKTRLVPINWKGSVVYVDFDELKMYSERTQRKNSVWGILPFILLFDFLSMLIGIPLLIFSILTGPFSFL